MTESKVTREDVERDSRHLDRQEERVRQRPEDDPALEDHNPEG